MFLKNSFSELVRKLIKPCLEIGEPRAAVPKLAPCELHECLGWVTMVQLDLDGWLSPASVKLFILFFGVSFGVFLFKEGRGRSAGVKVVLPALPKIINSWQAVGV